ncbi:MAG: hypothetical protein HXS48_16125 [Theionarchaea archaeon]|nr:hypothetical protein [Theionarchaea archaeon]
MNLRYGSGRKERSACKLAVVEMAPGRNNHPSLDSVVKRRRCTYEKIQKIDS